MPRFIESSTLRTISSAPSSLAREVAEIGHFGEVVAGVDHQQRVRECGRSAKRFFGAFEHHQRVLAARKQQGRALEGGGHFAQDEDGFFFQRVQVGVAQMTLVRCKSVRCLLESSSVRAFMRSFSG